MKVLKMSLLLLVLIAAWGSVTPVDGARKQAQHPGDIRR